MTKFSQTNWIQIRPNFSKDPTGTGSFFQIQTRSDPDPSKNGLIQPDLEPDLGSGRSLLTTAVDPLFQLDFFPANLKQKVVKLPQSEL